MRWYDIVRFRCPRCGQPLAVERGQAVRGETVTCQDCNAAIALRSRAPSRPSAVDARAVPVDAPAAAGAWVVLIKG